MSSAPRPQPQRCRNKYVWAKHSAAAFCPLRRSKMQLLLQAIDVLVRRNTDNVLRYGFKKVHRKYFLISKALLLVLLDHQVAGLLVAFWAAAKPDGVDLRLSLAGPGADLAPPPPPLPIALTESSPHHGGLCAWPVSLGLLAPKPGHQGVRARARACMCACVGLCLCEGVCASGPLKHPKPDPPTLQLCSCTECPPHCFVTIPSHALHQATPPTPAGSVSYSLTRRHGPPPPAVPRRAARAAAAGPRVAAAAAARRRHRHAPPPAALLHLPAAP